MKNPSVSRRRAVLTLGSLLLVFVFGCEKEQSRVTEKSDETPPPSEISPKENSRWTTVTLEDETYVTVSSLKKFYGFQEMKRTGDKLVLDRKSVRVEFTVGQQTVHMNGIKFVFSYPIRHSGDRYLVHLTDLNKLIDPVMRPNKLASNTDFDTVIIDPGHGGHDSGTVSPHGNGREKDHALTLAKKLSTELRKKGFKVNLTREDDQYLTLQQRVDHANRYPDAIFISLHYNAGGGGRAHGIETFTLSPQGVAGEEQVPGESDITEKPGNRNDSANIALATAVHSTCIKRTSRSDRGIRRMRYSVIAGVKHPAIHIEGGFLSHQEEGALIAENDYQDRLASAIAEGTLKYQYATKN